METVAKEPKNEIGMPVAWRVDMKKKKILSFDNGDEVFPTAAAFPCGSAIRLLFPALSAEVLAHF